MPCRIHDTDDCAIDVTLLPSAAIEVCHHLNHDGGHAYLVGGGVRDLLLSISPKDVDIEVYGLKADQLNDRLMKLGRVEYVGKQFGVYKLWYRQYEIDISLPRTEIKTDRGHRGFDILPDPHISPERASLRRDFTMNAMMYDPVKEKLYDFHRGKNDLRSGTLKHVSPAFSEDPLRVLRGMQFAARFKLTMYSETAELCRTLLSEADTLPPSRIWSEWKKWCHSARPSYGLKVLKDSGWIRLYPELEAMIDCPQAQRWHPEGDVWVHTLQVVDQAACIANRYNWQGERCEHLLLAALCHDMGKPACTFVDDYGVIKSPGHSHEGMADSDRFLKRIFAPKRFTQIVLPLVKEHITHIHGDPTPRAIRHLAHRLSPATIETWEALVEADASGRAPATASRPALEWLQQAEKMQNHMKKSAPIISGEMLIDLGQTPGPELGEILRKAYQAQLNGDFDDIASAKVWIRAFLGFH